MVPGVSGSPSAPGAMPGACVAGVCAELGYSSLIGGWGLGVGGLKAEGARVFITYSFPRPGAGNRRRYRSRFYFY